MLFLVLIVLVAFACKLALGYVPWPALAVLTAFFVLSHIDLWLLLLLAVVGVGAALYFLHHR